MCAAIDMLSSDHNRFYGRSIPPGFLTDYTIPQARRLTTRGHSSPSLSVIKPIHLNLKAAPRSILRLQKDKPNKNVVFADAKGLALEQVRFMTEPSHVPPFWLKKLIPSPPPERKLTQQFVDVWEPKFVQPASDYIEFRRRICEENVVLENVIVKKESALDGTVKVKNIGFTKEVLIRATPDGWRTYEDTSSEFIETGPAGKNGVSLYDTFGFRLQLPIHSRRLDFCVSFRCNDSEYWDNNFGANYTVEKASVKKDRPASLARIQNGNSWRSRTEATDGTTPYW